MKIVVASRSFAGNPTLRAELSSRYPNVTYTDSPTVLEGDPLIALLRGHDHAIVGLERIDEQLVAHRAHLLGRGPAGVEHHVERVVDVVALAALAQLSDSMIAAGPFSGNRRQIVMSSGAFGFAGSGKTETIGSFINNGGTFTTGANTLIGTGASS